MGLNDGQPTPTTWSECLQYFDQHLPRKATLMSLAWRYAAAQGDIAFLLTLTQNSLNPALLCQLLDAHPVHFSDISLHDQWLLFA